jgi:hypothetical protein
MLIGVSIGTFTAVAPQCLPSRSLLGWFTDGAVSIRLLGIVISLPLLVVLYALVGGRERFSTALIVGGCAYAVISGLFEHGLEMRWPAGILLGS